MSVKVVHPANKKFPWGLNDKTHPKESPMDQIPRITYKGKPHEDPNIRTIRKKKATQKTLETISKGKLDSKGGKQKSRRNSTRKNKRSRKNRH